MGNRRSEVRQIKAWFTRQLKRVFVFSECGDHICAPGARYPMDVIIRLHRHCDEGWDRHVKH